MWRLSLFPAGKYQANQEIDEIVNYDQGNLLIFRMTWVISNNLLGKVFFSLGWLAHLVSSFACNTRVIIEASSNPLVSNVKSM